VKRTDEPARAYIGLGSNLDDPERQVRVACGRIAALPSSWLLACSSLYATTPVGPVDQPAFINAVACIETALRAGDLLAALQGIERDQGRLRDGTRWGPRTLDLDLLLHGGRMLDEPGLTLPHPEIARRAFVLVPLAEIAPPDLVIPGQGRLDALLAHCPADPGMRRLTLHDTRVAPDDGDTGLVQGFPHPGPLPGGEGE